MARRIQRGADATGKVVAGGNHSWALQQFVNALNGVLRREEVLGQEQWLADEKRVKETPAHLREFVSKWREYGSSSRKVSRESAEFWQEVTGYGQGMLSRAELVPIPGGGAAIWWNSLPAMNPRGEALRWFIGFLMNPECSRLAGPCDRCGNYYIRKSARNKRYCSRNCGTRATATAATKLARAETHQWKLARARNAIRQYEKTRTKLAWKEWVSKKEREPEITPKFLTRAVNSGEIQEPSRISRKEK